MPSQNRILSAERLLEDKISLKEVEMISDDYLSFASDFDDPEWVRFIQIIVGMDISTIPSLTANLKEITVKLNEMLIYHIEDRKIREPIMGLIKELSHIVSYRAICQYEHSGRFVRVEDAHRAVEGGRKASHAATFEVLDAAYEKAKKRPKLKEIRSDVLKKRLELGLPETFSDDQLERHYTAWRKARRV